MLICKNCGVELEVNMNFCPLCGEAVEDQNSVFSAIPEVRRSGTNRQPLTEFQKLTRNQRRKLVWEIIGIILLSGGSIPLIINLIGSASITWSKYPAVICLVVFVNATLIVFWYKRVILLLLASFIVSSALLIVLDLYTGKSGWGLNLGTPLLLSAYLVVFGFIFLIRQIRQYGLNLIAFILITAGLLSICIDGIISLYARQTLHLGWSMIVMVSIIPVAAFLLLVHFRLKKGTDLKRFFHI